MSRWKSPLGRATALAVRAVARGDLAPKRPLSDTERAAAKGVYLDSLDWKRVRLKEGISGLLNVTARAFVIENTVYVPRGAVPLPRSVLIHELCHVWQFQNGGHAYIADSLQAQLVGEGYELARALARGTPWAELNCEQQATLVEEGYARGCFHGARFVLQGRDYTATFEQAITELRAGRGAAFRR